MRLGRLIKLLMSNLLLNVLRGTNSSSCILKVRCERVGNTMLTIRERIYVEK